MYYNNKVDVYSFGIVLWELLTNHMPFKGMSNLQAAYATAFKQERHVIPDDTPPGLAFMIQSCWVEDPYMRPSFSQIIRMLNEYHLLLGPPSSPEVHTPTVYLGQMEMSKLLERLREAALLGHNSFSTILLNKHFSLKF